MADSATLLVDEILPHQPMRQWVLSVPFPLRFLFASNPKVMSRVLGTVYRTIATHLTHNAGFTKPMAQTGAVTLIQRFGSALNLHIHFHMLFLDGVYIGGANGPITFPQYWHTIAWLCLVIFKPVLQFRRWPSTRVVRIDRQPERDQAQTHQ